MTVPAKYENGVFRPLDRVQIEEGTIVEVYVRAGRQRSCPRPRPVREFAFCGIWKDREKMADSVEYIHRLRENLRGWPSDGAIEAPELFAGASDKREVAMIG